MQNFQKMNEQRSWPYPRWPYSEIKKCFWDKGGTSSSDREGSRASSSSAMEKPFRTFQDAAECSPHLCSNKYHMRRKTLRLDRNETNSKRTTQSSECRSLVDNGSLRMCPSPNEPQNAEWNASLLSCIKWPTWSLYDWHFQNECVFFFRDITESVQYSWAKQCVCVSSLASVVPPAYLANRWDCSFERSKSLNV